MSFRSATFDDIPTLLRMQQVFFADAGDDLDVASSERGMRELIAHDQLGRLFVIDEEGTIAGYLVIGFGFSLEFGGRDAFVDELYIAPEWRNRGLGSQALKIAEEACAAAGVNALHLEVAFANNAAKALYARNGFYEHERLLMTKRLR